VGIVVMGMGQGDRMQILCYDKGKTQVIAVVIRSSGTVPRGVRARACACARALRWRPWRRWRRRQ
jgi:hypothetical protein